MLAVSMTACGGGAARKRTAAASAERTTSAAAEVPFPASTVPRHGYVKGDQDWDEPQNATGPDSDDKGIRDYGHAGDATDRRAATRLLRRYYDAAAAGDWRLACALTFAPLARSGKLVDAVSEDYRPVAGSPDLQGKSCAQVMSALTEQHHEELKGDTETLVVTSLRTRGTRALAIVGLRTTGERVVELAHEGSSWKVDDLFDAGVR